MLDVVQADNRLVELWRSDLANVTLAVSSVKGAGAPKWALYKVYPRSLGFFGGTEAA